MKKANTEHPHLLHIRRAQILWVFPDCRFCTAEDMAPRRILRNHDHILTSSGMVHCKAPCHIRRSKSGSMIYAYTSSHIFPVDKITMSSFSKSDALWYVKISDTVPNSQHKARHSRPHILSVRKPSSTSSCTVGTLWNMENHTYNGQPLLLTFQTGRFHGKTKYASAESLHVSTHQLLATFFFTFDVNPSLKTVTTSSCATMSTSYETVLTLLGTIVCEFFRSYW